MKKLWLVVVGCCLFSLIGCRSNKEIIDADPFHVLNQFLKMVNEVERYDEDERAQFMTEALSINKPSSFEPLASEIETISFTEAGPFSEDSSNTLNMKYNLVFPSKSLSLMLAYRFSPNTLSDSFQMALQTTYFEDSLELSLIFHLESNPIEDVFEALVPIFLSQTPIEESHLITQLKEVEASFEKNESGTKQIYSIYDDQSVLTVSYNPETKLMDLVTYDVDGFEKSIYSSDYQVYLSIVRNQLNQAEFEKDIYDKLVIYLDKRLVSEQQ